MQISDKAQLSDPKAGRLRLEKEFYRRTNGLLQFGGVMVLIIPVYTLDKELSAWIARHFNHVKILMAPEQRFQQAVFFGVRHRVTDYWATTDVYRQTRNHLIAIGKGNLKADELPEDWSDQSSSDDDLERYVIPDSLATQRFELVRLDGPQLADTLGHNAGSMETI